MKIAFYSPYLPKHTGGGEKYLFDCASIAATAGHEVFIALTSQSPLSSTERAAIKQRYEAFLNYSLDKITFITTPLNTTASFWEKLWWTKQFDCLYYQTDGSLFFSLAKKNILHIQVPLAIDKSSLLERLKLANWRIKNTNSYFTKKYIEKYWQTDIDYVHQPFVELPQKITQIPKKNIILSVGRFFSQLHSKRQDVLVEFFRQLCQIEPKLSKNWELVLVGQIEDQEYANRVHKLAQSLPITFHHHLNREELLKLYGQAKIYWHATGFGIDVERDPAKAEHFGISTLEAMAAGAVPVVINLGGQREIVTDELSRFLWNNKDECLQKTIALMKDEQARIQAADQARTQSLQFSQAKFTKVLLTMLER